jgi:hypothetical protein
VIPQTTVITTADSTNATAFEHLITVMAPIAGAGKKIRSTFLGRIFRDALHASDTYPADAALLEVSLTFKQNTVGSSAPVEKTVGLVTIADFSRGLWVAGAKAHSPLGTLRRARGVSPLRTTALQSRPGSVAIRAGVTAHSLARFGDVRFYGVGDTFQRGTATVQSGLNGNRLRTVRMPPTSGIDDYLMVAGGGELFKVQTTGSATKWGIAPPADGMTATLATQLSKDIQLFEDFTDWAEGDESDPPTLADEATIVLEGTNALKATIPSNTAGEFDFSAPVSLNLAQFATGSTPSPDEDYIQLWVHINRPQRVQAIGLAFEIAGPGTFDGSADFFSHESKIEADISKRSKQAHRGLGDLIFVADQDAAFLAQAHARPAQLTAMQALGRVDLIAARNAWSRLRVPKAAFDRSGNVSTSGWDSITAIRLTIRTNSGGADSGKATKVYFDACTMIGSVGMIGASTSQTSPYRVTPRWTSGRSGARSATGRCSSRPRRSTTTRPRPTPTRSRTTSASTRSRRKTRSSRPKSCPPTTSRLSTRSSTAPARTAAGSGGSTAPLATAGTFTTHPRTAPRRSTARVRGGGALRRAGYRRAVRGHRGGRRPADDAP